MPCVSVMGSTWTLVSVVAEATFIFSGMLLLLCCVFVCFHMSYEHVYAVCVCNGFDLDAGKRSGRGNIHFLWHAVVPCVCMFSYVV